MSSHSDQPNATLPDRPLRVLVADDEPMIRTALERLLQRRGHVVDTVGDAFGALELLEARSYDAVMVDARMPGGGLMVLSKLDEMSFQGVQVLMTGGVAADTGDVQDQVRRLHKPFRFPSVIPLLEGSPPA
jgi:CheY-like chemotaxis protein